jgi:uncharacterized protein (TIGR03437 family)
MSSGQINLQIPPQTPGGTQKVAVLRADTGEFLAGGVLAVAQGGPGLFTASQNGTGQVLALNQNGTLNGPSNPAPRGSVVQIFGTGQGPVDPAVPGGEPAPQSPLARTVAVPTSDGVACVSTQRSMCLAIGSTFGEVQFSGLAPGFVGLWQINVRIPETAITGDAVPIRAVVNGSPSNLATLAIQ